MRPFLLALVVGAATFGCAARGPANPSPRQQAASAAPEVFEPAPAPGEAFARAMRAWSEGDEAAYRERVVFRPPALLAEAQVRVYFAAARLHRAVRDRGVTGRRVRDAGFDRNETLLAPAPPAPASIEQAMKAYRRMEWKVDGNLATPATTRPLFDPDKQVRVERMAGRWVVVVSDSESVPNSEPQVRQTARISAIQAEDFNAAAAAVNAGTLRTVREVNDFIERRREERTRRAAEELKSAPPSGPVIVLTDAETGEPVAGATVRARAVIPGARYVPLNAVTDTNGRARLAAEPDSVHDISVEAKGYARRDPGLKTVPAQGDRPEEVHLTVGKPAVVEVTIVLPDERRAALSVYEGDEGEAAGPGVRDRLDPKRIMVPVRWEDEPPPVPEHHPLLRLQFLSSPHHGKRGVVHRVVAARTAAGRELPVFRDAPPADPDALGVLVIGTNGLGDTVLVIGTLADARATEAAATKFQWRRNTGVLGPSTRPATTSR